MFLAWSAVLAAAGRPPGALVPTHLIGDPPATSPPPAANATAAAASDTAAARIERASTPAKLGASLGALRGGAFGPGREVSFPAISLILPNPAERRAAPQDTIADVVKETSEATATATANAEHGGGAQGGNAHGGDAHSGSSHGEGAGGHGAPTVEDMHTTVVICAFLIGVTILFEKMREKAEHEVPPLMQQVVESMFGELTVLGFVSLVMCAQPRPGLRPPCSLRSSLLRPTLSAPSPHAPGTCCPSSACSSGSARPSSPTTSTSSTSSTRCTSASSS